MAKYIVELFGHCLHIIILYLGSAYLISGFFSNYFFIGITSAIGLTILLLYLRIPPVSPEQIEEIFGKNSNVIGHRGAGLDAPENTLAAFENCERMGCNFVEIDVSLTADGIPIVFHDKSTGRLCSQDLEISKTKWEDLKELNLSDKHPNKDLFPQTRILKLEEAVNHLLSEGQNMFIDIKSYDSRLNDVILDLYERHPELYNRSLITSFFATKIYLIRRKNPKIAAAVAWCPHVIFYANQTPSKKCPFWMEMILNILDIIHAWCLSRITFFLAGFSVILLHRYSLDIKSIADWRRKGVQVIAWTINKPIEKRYCEKILKIPYLTDSLNDDESADPEELDKQMTYLD